LRVSEVAKTLQPGDVEKSRTRPESLLDLRIQDVDPVLTKLETSIGLLDPLGPLVVDVDPHEVKNAVEVWKEVVLSDQEAE
jgi:hypothetical protein